MLEGRAVQSGWLAGCGASLLDSGQASELFPRAESTHDDNNQPQRQQQQHPSQSTAPLHQTRTRKWVCHRCLWVGGGESKTAPNGTRAVQPPQLSARLSDDGPDSSAVTLAQAPNDPELSLVLPDELLAIISRTRRASGPLARRRLEAEENELERPTADSSQ